MNGMEDREEVGNACSEDESVSSHCGTEDGNCTDSETKSSERKGEQD
jgi:hypothetical protein